MTKMIFFAVLLAALLLTSCAPVTRRVEVPDAAVALEAEKQSEIALKSLVEKQDRLSRVAYPLLVNATDLCPDAVVATLGMGYANKHVFPKGFQDAAIRLFGVGDPLEITTVDANSPAAEAGLQPGDKLIAVGGKSVPVGDQAAKEFREYLRTEIKPGQRIPVRVERTGEPLFLNIVPVAACGYTVVLSEQDEVNAFADGENVVITKGMIRFAESDQELALVIAHEIAHNTMEHATKKMGNYALGSILDIVAAAYGVNTQGAFGKMASQSYSQEFESEADYVGLYIMAKSGLEIENAQHFWRRLAAEHPGSIRQSHASSHPSTPQRFVEIEATIKEIKAKGTSGVALMPTLESQEETNGAVTEPEPGNR